MTKFGVVLLATLCLAMSSAFQLRTFNSSSGPKVEIFVLNLDGRADKCECMKSQLADSPYPVTRYSAVNPKTLHEFCPDMQNPSMRAHSEPGTMSLVCSNLQVWKLAHHTSDADFIVVFEDDTIIGEGFWKTLDSFLKGGCDEFDYVMVDPWKTGGGSLADNDPIEGCPSGDGFLLTKLSIGHNGAHMQIIRRTALKTMIQRAEDNMDHESTPDKFAFGAVRHGYPLRVAAGIAGIATQAHKVDTGKAPYGLFSLPSYCSETVWRDEDRKNMNPKLIATHHEYDLKSKLIAKHQSPFVNFNCV